MQWLPHDLPLRDAMGRLGPPCGYLWSHPINTIVRFQAVPAGTLTNGSSWLWPVVQVACCLRWSFQSQLHGWFESIWWLLTATSLWLWDYALVLSEISMFLLVCRYCHWRVYHYLPSNVALVAGVIEAPRSLQQLVNVTAVNHPGWLIYLPFINIITACGVDKWSFCCM